MVEYEKYDKKKTCNENISHGYQNQIEDVMVNDNSQLSSNVVFWAWANLEQ